MNAASHIERIAALTGRKPIKAPKPLTVRVQWPAMMDARIAEARRDMGEERWAELNAEWK